MVDVSYCINELFMQRDRDLKWFIFKWKFWIFKPYLKFIIIELYILYNTPKSTIIKNILSCRILK